MTATRLVTMKPETARIYHNLLAGSRATPPASQCRPWSVHADAARAARSPYWKFRCRRAAECDEKPVTLLILLFNFYPLTVTTIVMLAPLNGGAILFTAYCLFPSRRIMKVSEESRWNRPRLSNEVVG